VKPGNERSMRLCKSLGFKKVGMSDGWQMLELSLADGEAIKRIQDILNAR